MQDDDIRALAADFLYTRKYDELDGKTMCGAIREALIAAYTGMSKREVTAPVPKKNQEPLRWMIAQPQASVTYPATSTRPEKTWSYRYVGDWIAHVRVRLCLNGADIDQLTARCWGTLLACTHACTQSHACTHMHAA